MTAVMMKSTSRAEDAGFLALADVATVADQLGADYRLIGGHMVSVLVAVFQVKGVPSRETSDADLGAEFSVVGDQRLLDALTALGYARPGASNRFVRPLGDDQNAVIDVLAPSFTGRHEPNQRHGNLVVDEIPGLLYALGTPPVTVELEADLTTGARIESTIRVPSPLPALCLKLLSWNSRLAAKDATDIWRMLAVCDEAGITPSDWPDNGTTRDARAALRKFAGIGGMSRRQLTPDRRIQVRIRALAHRVGGLT